MLRRPLSCSSFSSLSPRCYCAGQCRSTIYVLMSVAVAGARATRTELENNILFPREIPFALACIVVAFTGFSAFLRPSLWRVAG